MKIDFLILSLRHELGPRTHVDGRQNALKAMKDGLSNIGCSSLLAHVACAIESVAGFRARCGPLDRIDIVR